LLEAPVEPVAIEPVAPASERPPRESGPRMHSARPVASQSGTPLHEIVTQVITEYRGHVLERIRKANDLSSTSVVAVGTSLDRIVTVARAQVQETRAALDGLSGTERRGVTELIEEQSRLSRSRFGAIRAAIEEQGVLVRDATQASSQIASVGAEVTKVAFQARLLSLNANIEAARLGDQGAGFQVIATEMQRLTEEIDRANRKIGAMASNLMVALPKINQQNDELIRHSAGFTEELSENSAAVGAATGKLRASVDDLLGRGDQAANQVLSGSNDALSNLQFQDPMAQNLLIIDADLGRLAEHIQRLLKDSGAESALVPDDTELDLSAAEANLALNAGTVAAIDQGDLHQAGEVLLF
jgi:methyl-accepting chemotaxis protein